MFIVKATYGRETRRFTLAQTTFPSFDLLYGQLLRVLPAGRKYYLTKVMFSSGIDSPQLIAQEVHNAEQFDNQTARLSANAWTHAKLRFNVNVESSAPEAQPPVDTPSAHSSSTPFRGTTSGLSSPTSRNDKQEIRQLMEKFLVDFGRIMSSTFGEIPETAATSTPTLTTPSEETATPQQEPASKPIHYNITCDVCNRTVVGVRYKCLDCVDYDQCEECIRTKSVTHPLHQFLEIPTPGNVVVHTIDDRQRAGHKVHNASCDLCDSRIRGDRYKCTNCPDFDVCGNCYKITPQQHPAHIFVRISDPGDIMPGIPQDHKVAHSARCNACNKMIYGFRYKCLMCPDFDLCMHCEALPISVHPDTHVFCKIKSDTITASHPLFKSLASHNSEPESSYQPEYMQSSSLESDSSRMPTISITKTVSLEENMEKVLPDIPMSPLISERTASPLFRGTPKAPPVLRGTFLSDNNMPDGQIIAPGAEFVKSWSMKNDGNCIWPESSTLVFIAGNRLGAFDDAPTQYKVGAVEIGATVDVWAGDMKAPDEPGRYVSYWSLQDDEGCLFGPRIWCDIVVPELDLESSRHSVSISLPTMKAHADVDDRSSIIPGFLPPTSSEITDPVGVSTQSGTNSASLDSKEFEDWEEADSEPPQQTSSHDTGSGAIPVSVEWVLLDDD